MAMLRTKSVGLFFMMSSCNLVKDLFGLSLVALLAEHLNHLSSLCSPAWKSARRGRFSQKHSFGVKSMKFGWIEMEQNMAVSQNYLEIVKAP